MTVLEQAKTIRAAMNAAGAKLDDETAVQCAALFPLWAADRHYATGVRVRYRDILYKCLLAHDAQVAWTPDAAPSLWVRIDDPVIEWPAWVQPAGATDAYAVGAKVSHGGKRWISRMDGNAYEPGAAGIGPAIWEEQAA